MRSSYMPFFFVIQLLLSLDNVPDSSCMPLVISAAEENARLHNHHGQARADADFGGKNTAWLNLPDYTLRGNDGPRASASTGLHHIKEETPQHSASGDGCTTTMRSSYMPFFFVIQLGKPLRSPVDFLNPATLNGVLQHALHSSLRGDTPEASNLSLDARRIPSAIAPGQNILSCLVLKYKIDWPLNIVITSPCLLRYNKIFGFLLYIRRTQWALFDIWCNLKPSALPRNPHGSPQFQQLQLMRHEMQQFVQLLQGYVGGQVMQTSLAELQDDLDRQVRNVDDLRNTHLLFLKRLSQRLLLARRATPVAKLLREALRTVLLFQAELSAQSWLVEGGELRHPAFRRFQHAHTKFRQTVNLLLTTLTSWEELQCRQSCFKLSSVLGSTAFLWPDAAVHGQDVGGSPSEAQTAPSDCSGVSSIACNLSF
ncbi:hypothetical protein ISCGN_023983 [Ixodes scapularis]